MELESCKIDGWKESAIYIALAMTFILLALTTIHTGFNSIFAQLFFIPITLASLWNGRKGVILALLYGLTGVTITWLTGGHLALPDLFQAAMYAVVAAVISVPADRKKKLLYLTGRSEEKLHNIASTLDDGVMVADREGKLIYISPAAADITGCAPGGSLDSAGGNETVAVFRQAVAENKPVIRDIEVPDGKENKRILELRVAPAYSGSETTTGFIGSLRDVTENRKALAALQDSADLNARLLESFPGLILRSDCDGKGVYFNQNWAAFTGRSQAQDLDDGWQSCVHPADLGRRLRAFREAGGEEFECVYRLRRADKVFRWMMEVCRPCRDGEGRISGHISFVYDITDRRAATEELDAKNYELQAMYSISSTISQYRDLREMFGQVLEQTNSLISASAGAVYIEDGSRPGVLRLTACATEEAAPARFTQETTLQDLAGSGEVAVKVADLDEWMEPGPGQGQLILVPLKSMARRVGMMAFYYLDQEDSSSGSRWDQSYATRLTSIGSHLGTVIDCALQYNKLLKQNSHLTDIIEEAPDGILTTNSSGNICTFNRQASRLLKYAASEVTGKHISAILQPGSNINIKPCQSYVREFRAGDDSTVKLNISTARLPSPDSDNSLIITLKDLTTVSGLKIVPVSSDRHDPDQEYRFKKGVVYLIDKQKIDYHMDIFADQVKRDSQGLCISRLCPKLIRDKYGLKETPTIWLSNCDAPGENITKINHINSLTAIVSEFIESGSNGTLMLDGMEYLIARNGFDTMLKFAQFLNDQVMVSNCCAMFCIDTQALDKRQLHLLLTEMTEFKVN
ncbi:DUF835 domain-containing protein [Methanocella sp. MCL-LM]|uniref:DUF835 domain-containing protein n=1 Tax=Methanocella sp. MCL-LM TaxID=3412035 RepID=UPI003C760C84